MMMDDARVTLDQLRVLVTIRDTGSFSAAGRALGRVQSAISQAVKSLEEAHGVARRRERYDHRLRVAQLVAGRVCAVPAALARLR